MTFEQLGIAPNILKAIQELGFEQPMPVQAEVIPLLLAKNTDIVALAQTGTGKTAAFGLPVIQQIDVTQNHVQALIMAPTRELCLQIADDLADYSKYMNGLYVVPVYGGASIDKQIGALRRGCQIIVATPGRLIDLVNRKVAKLDRVSKVILDEADEMLNMGFSESIDEILSHLPKERNTLLFSATMPKEIASISKKYMSNPVEVTVGTKNQGADTVKHQSYIVHAKDKYHTLKRIADFYPNIYGIVFCRTKIETQEIADKLIHDGYNAEALHGDLSQAQRDYVMNKFRIKNLRLLVATDVAARGIDVDSLTHVINFNLPDDIEAYTHRSGRTGRAGKAGISIVITNMKEKYRLRDIERMIGKQFQQVKVPNGREICEKQLFHLIDKVEKVEIDQTEIEPFLPMVYKKLEWLEKEELIQRLVSLEFNRFLEYYKNAPDLNVAEDSFKRRDNRSDDREPRRRDRGDREPRDQGRERSGGSVRRDSFQAEKGYTRFFINLGRMDGINKPNALIELLNRNASGPKIPIGRIDLMKNFSFFEAESGFAKEVTKAFKDATYEGRKIVVEITKEEKDRGKDRK